MANNSKKYISLNRLSDFLDNLKNIFAPLIHKHTTADITNYTVDTELSATSENPIANKTVDAEFTAVNNAFDAVTGVLDTMGDAIDVLSEAVNNHNHNDIYYTETEIDEKLSSALTRVSTVTLNANNWTGESNYWYQVVNVSNVTANSKIDLNPTAAQIVELQDLDIALMAENNSGTVTIYVFGGKPTSDYIMQVTITEVVPV